MKYAKMATGTLLLGGLLTPQTALAQSTQPRPSTCLAVAENLRTPETPRVHFASFKPEATPVTFEQYEVAISYQGHSTYLIESAGGVKIATDFAGWLTDPIIPTAITMNQAHSSHYTDFPDPKIKHVLRGWGTDGKVADHYLNIEDVIVRNVTTDILRFATVPDGNSIFIFEVAGLCIGHLGHLHHKLSEDHYTKIGRLDVVMVPVDGGLTLTHVSMRELLDRMRSTVVLPMHVRFAGALPQFLSHLGDGFAVETRREKKLILSLKNLPKRPTVYLLPGVSNLPAYDE